MLISCFQCRQQLDVPEDSSGKRVRCPHCQYVIVVPAKARQAQAEGIAAPTTALPSMELDGDADKATPTTKLPAQSLPPFDLPPTETGKSEPPSAPPMEEPPPMPSIDRGKRRRAPLSPLPPSRAPWGRILGIGAVVALLAIVAIAIFSARENRPHRQPPAVVFQDPRRPEKMKEGIQVRPNPNQGFNPGMQNPNFQFLPPPPLAALWQNVSLPEHRFKAQFPGNPAQHKRDAMTVFEINLADWEFAVAHRALTEKDYQAIALQDRFSQLVVNLSDIHGAGQAGEQNILLADVHPGREWNLLLPDNRSFYVRTYYVREGKVYHHYLLTAKGPMNTLRNHADIDRFFNSFGLLLNDGSGQMIFEELDAIDNGGRRESEFTALALHPKLPIAVTGTLASHLKITVTDGPVLKKEQGQPVEDFEFKVQEGKPIEQLAIAPDGRWLAVAAAGEVRFWQDWTDGVPKNETVVPGLRCAFTRKNRLMVASKDDIREYKTDPHQLVSTLAIPDMAIKGFALSADERTLAVHGDKAITLWQWPEKKLLGRIEAHDAPITALAFAPDGKTLASAGVDRTIKLWHVDTRAERATLRQHAWTVWSLAFAPDGKTLASGGLDGMVLLWDLEPDLPRLVWAQSHQFPVRAVAFDGEGKHLYLTCKHPAAADPVRGQVYLRQLRRIARAEMKPNPQEAARIVARHAALHLPASSTMAYFSPDGKTFVTTTDGIDRYATMNSLRVWDTATATLRHAHSMKGSGFLSPDGKWFAFAKPGPFNQVQLLEVEADRVSENTLTLAGDVFPLMMFTPDSQSLWILRNHEFVLYDIRTPPNGNPMLVQKKAVKLKEPNDPRMLNISASDDQKTFLVEFRSNNAFLRTDKLYALADGKVVPRPKAAPGAWSPYIRLRQLSLQVELRDFLQGNSQTIGQQRQALDASAIDPEHKYAATTNTVNESNRTLHLWDLRERRPLLTLPDLRTRRISALRFAPDGRYLAVVSGDKIGEMALPPGDGWTRIVPMDWLLERQALLPCHPNEVARP